MEAEVVEKTRRYDLFERCGIRALSKNALYQVSAEAIIPLNREGGSGLGARLQLLLFTDDIVPSLFGKPLLSQQSTISTVEKYPGH